jgi:hypothetical protein
MPNHLSAYPNPFIDSLSFEVEIDNNISTIVRIFDQQGRIAKLLSWNLKKGVNKTTLAGLEGLAAGDFTMEIKDMKGNTMFSTKLTKA